MSVHHCCRCRSARMHLEQQFERRAHNVSDIVEMMMMMRHNHFTVHYQNLHTWLDNENTPSLTLRPIPQSV
jgi:hypothetical protein